jgi:hypothetical protein
VARNSKPRLEVKALSSLTVLLAVSSISRDIVALVLTIAAVESNCGGTKNQQYEVHRASRREAGEGTWTGE